MTMRRGCAMLLLAGAAAARLVQAAPPAPPAPPTPLTPDPARVQAGQRLFARCAGCHQIGPNAGNVFGPHLNGVVGRKAGAVAGYAYSPALKQSTLVWNEQTLVAFIRDTNRVAPGNKMRFFNFMSERQVSDIVAYLKTQNGAGPQRAGRQR